MGESQLPVYVSIPSTGALKGIMSSSVGYTTLVRAFDLPTWEVRKPYDDYVALRKALETGLSVRLPPLPPTFWYGNTDPNVVEERRQSLEKFVTEALIVCTASDKCSLRTEVFWSFLNLPHVVRQLIYFLRSPDSDTRRSQVVGIRMLLPEDGAAGCPALWHGAVLDALLSMVREQALTQEMGEAVLDIISWQLRHGRDCWKLLIEKKGLEAVLDMGVSKDDRDFTSATATAIRELLFTAGPSRWSASVSWVPELGERFHRLLASHSVALQEAVACVLWATCASSEESALQFMHSAVSSDRKMLMNALFTSQSSTVKVLAGAFFSRLLPLLARRDGSSVAEKTEEGLDHLLSDLCDPSADKAWQEERLFSILPWRDGIAELLLSPCAAARTFSLFVIKKTGNGEGLRKYVAAALPVAQTCEERAALAELLLSAWAEDFENGSDDDVLRISKSLGDESYSKISAKKERIQGLRDYRSEQEQNHESLMQHFSALQLPSMQTVDDAFRSQQAALGKLQDRLDEATDALQFASDSAAIQEAETTDTISSSSNIATIWTEAAELLRRRNAANEALEEINADIERHETELETIGAQRMELEKARSDMKHACQKIQSQMKGLEEHAHQARHFAYAVLPEMRTALDAKKRDVEEQLSHAAAGSDAYRRGKRDLASVHQEFGALKNPEDMEVEAKVAEEQVLALKEQHAAHERSIEECEARTRSIDADLVEASKPLPQFRLRRKELTASRDEVVRLWDDSMLPHVQREHTYFLERWKRCLGNARDKERVEVAQNAVLSVDQQFSEEHEARLVLKNSCLELMNELQQLVNILGD